MLTILFALLCTSLPLDNHPQDGVYRSLDSLATCLILLEGDRFCFMVPCYDLYDPPIDFFPDTMAVCRISQVEESYFKIDSSPRNKTFLDGISFKTESFPSGEEKTGVQIVLRFPNYHGSNGNDRLTIQCGYSSVTDRLSKTDINDCFEKDISAPMDTIHIPYGASVFNLQFIEPKRTLGFGIDWGFPLFDDGPWGLGHLNLLWGFPIPSDARLVEVVFPSVTWSLFQRYVVRGEYVKYSENELIWRGRRFLRVRDLIS